MNDKFFVAFLVFLSIVSSVGFARILFGVDPAKIYVNISSSDVVRNITIYNNGDEVTCYRFDYRVIDENIVVPKKEFSLNSGGRAVVSITFKNTIENGTYLIPLIAYRCNSTNMINYGIGIKAIVYRTNSTNTQNYAMFIAVALLLIAVLYILKRYKSF